MYLRCLLVPTAPGLDPTRRLEAALRLSRRLAAHFAVAYIAPDPAQVLASLPSLAPIDGTLIETIASGVRQGASEGEARLRTWCERRNVPLVGRSERLDATFASWNEYSGEVEPVLTRIGRVHDLVVVDRPVADEPFTGRALDTALFAIGRPTLMVGEEVPDDFLRHVVIAWNGSLEATRLIGQAVTLLHEAERVSVVHAESGRPGGTPAADLCTYLRWHGIVAQAVTIEVVEGQTAGAAILAEAEGLNGSMLALGAYTHSRVREFLLGGVTRHMIENARMPVLMAH